MTLQRFLVPLLAAVSAVVLVGLAACPPPVTMVRGDGDAGKIDKDAGERFGDAGTAGDAGKERDAGPVDGALPLDAHNLDASAPDRDAGSIDAADADAGVALSVHWDADGRLTIVPGVWRSAECPGCADDDNDGIVDDAEAFLLDALVPDVVLLGDDPALGEPGATLISVGRVAFAAGGSRLRVFMMLGYARDYGSCGFTAHAGDSERVAFELDVDDDAWRLRRAYTAAHEGEATDRSRLVAQNEVASVLQFTTDDAGWPRPVVYSSHNKHATYVSESACADAFSLPCFVETCAPNPQAGVVVRPVVSNAGEAAAPLLGDLSTVGWPNEDAWADQSFCGGQRAADGSIDEGCSSPVFEKLTTDPFL